MIQLSWTKFYLDFFDDARVQVIETMPDADAIYSIWFKLLAFVGRQNPSGVFLIHTGGQADDLPITEEVISTVTRRPITTVRLALSTFERLGLIERVGGVYAYTDWERIVDQQRLRSLEERRERKALGTGAKKQTKEEIVLAYAAEHPEATKSEIARETGVSRPSVIKYLRNASPAQKELPAPVSETVNGVKTGVKSGLSTFTGEGVNINTDIDSHFNSQKPEKQLVDGVAQEVSKTTLQNKIEDIDIRDTSSSDVAGDNLTGRSADRPTLAEVRAFFSEQRLRIDPDRFFDVNERRGWVTNTGKPVDDWKGLALTWNRHQTGPAPSAATGQSPEKQECPSVEEVMRDYHCDRETAEEMIREDPFF